MFDQTNRTFHVNHTFSWITVPVWDKLPILWGNGQWDMGNGEQGIEEWGMGQREMGDRAMWNGDGAMGHGGYCFDILVLGLRSNKPKEGITAPSDTFFSTQVIHLTLCLLYI